MFGTLAQLIVLFIVIIDPLASLVVFFTASARMSKKERRKIATLAIFVATMLSFLVLIFGESLLKLFSTSLDEFRIAGGIILMILGIKMTLGIPLTSPELKANTGRAIAAVIGTPLLTGPATITAIIVSVHDYGRSVTGLAVAIVLVLTAIIFYSAERVHKFTGVTTIQVMSTILGLVTVAWGVRFIATGLLAII